MFLVYEIFLYWISCNYWLINSGVLKPGSQYKMELNVSKGELVTTEEYDIYIYEYLRGCEVETRPMVEIEEVDKNTLQCKSLPC